MSEHDERWFESRKSPLEGEELERLLAYTKANYGTAEMSESGVDLSRLRANLRLTPDRRLKQVEPALAFYAEIRARNANRRRSDP
jgi:hypothetical protein